MKYKLSTIQHLFIVGFLFVIQEVNSLTHRYSDVIAITPQHWLSRNQTGTVLQISQDFICFHDYEFDKKSDKQIENKYNSNEWKETEQHIEKP